MCWAHAGQGDQLHGGGVHVAGQRHRGQEDPGGVPPLRLSPAPPRATPLQLWPAHQSRQVQGRWELGAVLSNDIVV